MSKKAKKKIPTGAKPVQQQAQRSDARETRVATAPPRSAAKDISAFKDRFSTIESKWLDMSDQTWFRSAAVITAIAAFLRFFMITIRPFHHDEGVNGWMMTNLLRDNNYKYDPANYHGPLLYYIAYPFLKLFGLNTIPARVSVAIFGLLMVVFVLLLRRYLGNIGSLLGAFFVAISPGMVFISRYFIHEILFVFLSIALVVCVVFFIERRAAGIFATAWMALILLVCFLPGALLLGGYLGGENESAVTGLRLVLFAVDAALVYYLMKKLLAWHEGRPIYFLLASACTVFLFATKETAFITLGTMAIACVCIWIWEKIGPANTSKKNLLRNVMIGNALVVATGLYYYQNVADAYKWLHQELITNAYRPPDPFLFYSLLLLVAVSLVTWIIYVADLKHNNEPGFTEPSTLSWKNFRLGLGEKKDIALMLPLAAVLFAYLGVLLFTSFFSYREGVSKAFEAYKIWTQTGTKEHAQNGFFAYLKWGMKGEPTILFVSVLGSLVAIIKARNRFAMFTALWAIGVFAAYMIIPYKTPWLALSYILPMCMVAGYGLGEFILSGNRRLNLAAYALIVIGTVVLLYQTYELNFVRYDDDQMPYVYAHTRRGFLGLIAQVEHYAEKSGKGKDIVIDVTSPDYWPMTWYVVDYNHVGYHGHVIDNPQSDIIITKKKDQDAEAIAKYSENYRYVGMYPLRPGVDLNLLVRKDLADPDTQDLSVIPSVPLTP